MLRVVGKPKCRLHALNTAGRSAWGHGRAQAHEECKKKKNKLSSAALYALGHHALGPEKSSEFVEKYERHSDEARITRWRAKGW